MQPQKMERSKARSKIWDALQPHYGGLLILHDAPEQTGISATPVVVTGFASNMATDGTFVTADFTTNTITISKTGNYFVAGNFNFLGQNNKNYEVEMYINGVATGAQITVRSANTIDEVGAGFSGILPFTKGAVVDLRVWSPDGGTAFTPHSVQFLIEKK